MPVSAILILVRAITKALIIDVGGNNDDMATNTKVAFVLRGMHSPSDREVINDKLPDQSAYDKSGYWGFVRAPAMCFETSIEYGQVEAKGWRV